MKFQQQLALKAVPKYRDHYLDYKELKSTLYDTQRKIDGLGDSQENGKQADELVNDLVYARIFSELDKVNKFYIDKVDSCLQEYNALSSSWNSDMSEDEATKWKKSFKALLTELELLNDFFQLNVTGCHKILKKASKVLDKDVRAQLWPKIAKYPFIKSEKSDQLMNEAYSLWRKKAPLLEDSDNEKKNMTPPKKRRPSLVTHTPFETKTVSYLDHTTFPQGEISRVWVTLADNGMGLPVKVPVMIAKGAFPGPVVGITAALHGNEVNGIPLIHQLFEDLDPKQLHGTVIAVPVANAPGFMNSQRGYVDGTDLNRMMPGKPNGSSPQVYAYNLLNRIVKNFEYLIDLHTASRGRANSLYVRANMLDSRTRRMARLQNPQIIVHNTSPDGSLRGAAMECRIPAITLEIGDPSRFQKRFVRNALLGVTNILSHLQMIPVETERPEYDPVVCTRSYWIFARSGGILSVLPEVNTWVREGEPIAYIHSVFGELVETYYAPDDGIVVGKHVDPVCQSGNRILHLGVVEDQYLQHTDDGHL
ncbi:hypothetical protein H4219_001030 [Mycoemilia scoparia]|uniref:SPX domain-containing protein n=1 Tax=Mycoemilia scoparia TaxID=417184 RepID=A0A9W8DVU5_9FUNG|nr:hypothetical protein H4219_001030 [Mycoemilia scoparia]